MKTFTATLDDIFDEVLNELKNSLIVSSKADVFRHAIAVFKTALDGYKKGLRLVLVDEDDQVQEEIAIPWNRLKLEKMARDQEAAPKQVVVGVGQ